MTESVVFVGGPLHGRLRPLGTTPSATIFYPEPLSLVFLPDGDGPWLEEPVIKTVRYDLKKAFYIVSGYDFIHPVWTYTAANDNPEEKPKLFDALRIAGILSKNPQPRLAELPSTEPDWLRQMAKDMETAP